METVEKLVITKQGGWERMNRQCTEDFYASENILCDTIMVMSWCISLNLQDVQYQQCKLQTLVATDVSR